MIEDDLLKQITEFKLEDLKEARWSTNNPSDLP